jgi:hypothetical protein
VDSFGLVDGFSIGYGFGPMVSIRIVDGIWHRDGFVLVYSIGLVDCFGLWKI